MAKQPQSCAFRTSIGGQALIEGILMRGPEKQAIVVRDQEGNLVEKVEELWLIKDRHPILGWPLIRGTVNFLSSMVNGVKALMYSADFYPEEETTEPSKFEQWLDRTFSNKKLEGLIVGLSVLLGIGLSIFLFLVLGVLLYLYMEHRGLAMPEKTDQVFSLVAVGGGLPLVVGVLFVIGLISSTYSAAGSALTALTTSFTVDILEGTKRYGEARLTRIRRGVHVAMALGMALVILAFGYLADDSVINLVYKVASYTYGPIWVCSSSACSHASGSATAGCRWWPSRLPC